MQTTAPAFVRIYLAVAALLLAAVSTLNFFVDAAGIFRRNSSIERAMADTLRKREAIVIGRNYDERRFQQFRIELEPIRAEVLVAGSSRVMQVGGPDYPWRVLNVGVSGASIEDSVALVSMAVRRFRPAKIVLGLDPWVLNAWDGQNRWMALESQYREAVAELMPAAAAEGAVSAERSQYLQLVNFGYTMESLRKLRELVSLARGEDPVQSRSDDTPLEALDLIRQDGTRVYSRKYASRSFAEIEAEGDRWVSYSMAHFSFSERHWQLLVAFVEHLQQRHVVEFFLAPYYPATYARMLERRPEVPAVEERLRRMALDRGIKVLGSFDPARAGCARNQFYDGAHPSRECVSHILSRAA